MPDSQPVGQSGVRLTKPQRALLSRLADEGDLCIKGSADRRVIWSLSRDGLVRSIDGRWYSITPEGRSRLAA